MIGQEMAKADAETTFKLSSEKLAKLKDLHQEVSLVVFVSTLIVSSQGV